MTVDPPYVSDNGARDGGWVEFSVTDALAFGWRRFSSNIVVWIPLVVGAAVVSASAELISSGFEVNDARDVYWPGSYSVGAVAATLVVSLVNWLLNAVLLRCALDETYGTKASFSGAFRLGNVVAVLLASFLVALGVTIGTLLLVVPGLVFMFLTYYTLPFVLDKGEDAVTALRSSFALVSANVGRLLLLTLAAVALNLIGALVLVVGLLVTMPVTLIATTYAFRVLQGERI